MLHARLARGVVDVEGAVDIDLEALARILSAGVERQDGRVEEPVHAGEDGRQPLTIADIARFEAYTTALECIAEMRIARIEIEHDDLGGIGGEQPVDDVGADEAGASGDEEPVSWDLHAGASWRGTRTDARARRTPSAPPRASAHASKGLDRPARDGRLIIGGDFGGHA